MTDQDKRPGNAARLLSACLISGCLALVAMYTTGCNSSSDGDAAKKDGNGQEADKDKGEQPPAEPKTGREVLQRMVAAYQKASSYTDRGTVRTMVTVNGEQRDQLVNLAVTFVRPNKIRLNVYQATVVCDGEQLQAKIPELPDQVVAVKAPDKLSMATIFSDPVLARELMRGSSVGLPPQLTLLLEDEPLQIFLHQAEEPVLTEPGVIGTHPCHRVKITWPYGTATFWIDRKSYVLRRLMPPTQIPRQRLEMEGTVEHLLLEANFNEARFDGSLESDAFAFVPPQRAQPVEFFIPPHPGQLLGKSVPPFEFVDLDGAAVTPKSIAGKVAVLDFWATTCAPCRTGLPRLQQVYQKYGDKVAFYAVSVDNPKLDNKALQDTFEELGVRLPILRDMQGIAGLQFRFEGIPISFLVDANGVIRDVETAPNEALTSTLPEKLDKLIAGEDISQQALADYQQWLDDFTRSVQQERERLEAAGSEVRPVARSGFAEKSSPESFKLMLLWTCKDLTMPLNILTVDVPGGLPRVLVVDNLNSVAEVALDTGKVVASHDLGIDANKENVITLRTITAGDGRRYYAAVGLTQQRFHLFDEQWKLVFRFPSNALEYRHDGIADVQLGDLDGDGTPEAYVGYYGLVGVQQVSWEGKRLWPYRSIADVRLCAVIEPDATEKGSLLVANGSDGLTAIDMDGSLQKRISVPEQKLWGVVAADLDSDQRPELCAMAGETLDSRSVVGLNLDGEVLWQYKLPPGLHELSVEPIVAGRLSPTTPGQWLLVGPDSSIHILSAAGKLLDRFNTGIPLQGLATAAYQDQLILLISSSKGLQAWKVE